MTTKKEQSQTGDHNLQIGSAENVNITFDKKHPIGNAPRCPKQFVGRVEDLAKIKSRLGI